MVHHLRGLAGIMLATGLVACSDADAPTAAATRPADRSALASRADLRTAFQRYVAIGTSLSAGVEGDGLIALTQAVSWPEQLSVMGGHAMTQPYINLPGCRSPIIPPLVLQIRLSGEPATRDPAQLSCATLRSGVTLPVENVALSGALTKDALFTTPETITDAGNAKIYSRVLEPGATQVSTMLEQTPTLVSVELGANEILGAQSGVAIPGVTLFPIDQWTALYDALLDNVQHATSKAVLVGLIDDVADFPSFRRGSELWNDRAEFARFNVAVLPDCENSDNLVFIPLAIPAALGAGVMSCSDRGPTTPDFILTPAEAAIVNGQMHAMSATIQGEALRRGFAYFALGALYDRPGLKGTFSLGTLLFSLAPFGPYISVDGVHPSALGNQILARAAAQALNTTYGLGIPVF
jgi:lysophospholipase L1-like esterase